MQTSRTGTDARLLTRACYAAVIGFAIGLCRPAAADAVTDWNRTAAEIAASSRGIAPVTNRAMAIVQTAVYAATNSITHRYPAIAHQPEADRGASVDAAVAAANHVTLVNLFAAQRPAIDTSYAAALAKIPDNAMKSAGVAAGEKAATAVLEVSKHDGADATESYRPYTTAGMYVPTFLPVATQWPQRKPWLLQSPSQFRPGPPPALTSAIWARDYNESKIFGGEKSERRTAEQTAIARFWEAASPPIFGGIIQSVARQPGREVTQNARLFAAVTQAMDDAAIAVMDAKYTYNFWRPVTAIRNGDIDGNDATERDPSWLTLLFTPPHPEYPCAHCIMASTVGTVLKAELGSGVTPLLTTNSPTADNAARSWATIDEFVAEVSNARIFGGMHYRNSTEVGNAMGKQIGELAAQKFSLGTKP